MDLLKKEVFEIAKDNKVLGSLLADSPEHKEMFVTISENLPELNRAISLFGKTQSQFMDNNLTVSHLTPLRNLRQILAEINKTKDAFADADIKSRRTQVEMNIINDKIEKLKSGSLKPEEVLFKDDKKEFTTSNKNLAVDLLELEIEEKMSGLFTSKNYVSGAVRKIRNYIEQYNTIKENFDIGEFTEEDLEAEEEGYHISKAFQQGLCAARASGGVIDHGNQIYFEQIGINGAVASALVLHHLKAEAQVGNGTGKEPSYEMYLDFIDAMKEKFKGCSKIIQKYKGMTSGPTETALLK